MFSELLVFSLATGLSGFKHRYKNINTHTFKQIMSLLLRLEVGLSMLTVT